MRPTLCRRLVLLIATMVASVLIVPSHLVAQQPADQLSAVDRVVVATRIYATIRQYFAHWDGAPRLEIEAAYREYVDGAIRAAARKDFDLATLRFIATLRNGHTQFFDSQLDSRPLKFRLLPVEGQWVVVNSQDNQLPRGAVVRSLDGRLVNDFVHERAKSSPRRTTDSRIPTSFLIRVCFLSGSGSVCRTAMSLLIARFALMHLQRRRLQPLKVAGYGKRN